MTLYPEPLYSYSLCLHPATFRLVSDGKRKEMLPVCDPHWERLFGEGGRPGFSIDSAPPSDPVIEPDWLA